jgi:tRNA(adenine34) deaminase
MHDGFMREALALAAEARDAGEVPVGALVVIDGVVVGRGYNRPIGTHDPTAHAEIVAIRAAAGHVANYRLSGATLYVTVEPCMMCVGAIVHARIDTLVFGATEPRAGAIESTGRFHEHRAFNHRFVVVSGVLAAECGEMMRTFFRDKR